MLPPPTATPKPLPTLDPAATAKLEGYLSDMASWAVNRLLPLGEIIAGAVLIFVLVYYGAKFFRNNP